MPKLFSNTPLKRLERAVDDLRYRRAIDDAGARAITDLFHRLYFESGRYGRSWGRTHWRGVRALKCPFDLWVYQEILADVRPELIVETGTRYGGSALFLADCCELLGRGRVLTIDIEHQPDLPEHPRIEYLLGSSVDPAIVERARAAAAGAAPVLVILDSDHRRDHVLAELRAYAPLVTRGSYLIVEDSNLNGHPVFEEHGPGPYEAIEAFLAESDELVPDREREEKFFLTFNPMGYLRKR
jgi:cephalosporin hydroxylase